MPMPSDVTGRLVMTKDSGEQSSFSTPFIDEFDHISNRYYQYFELVVLSKSGSFDPDIDNCIFHVYLKNKDYTEMDNNFEKGLDLKFGYLSNSLNEVLSCTYKNYEKSYTDNNVAQLGDYIGRNSNNSNCDIISFLIYPETCDDETFVDEYNVFDDIYYHELLVFLNGTLIAKNIKIPDTLMSNFSIGCTIEEDISNNFSYQWNFSNDRFIYMDLAYQCYEEITTKNMSDYRYFPLYRLNHTHESDDKYDLIMLPYVNFSNSDIKKFGIEVTMRIPDATKLDELFEGVGQYDNLILFRIILAPVKANHRYLYSKYLDTPISYTDADLLDEKLGIQVSGSISYNRNVYEMGIRDINGSNLTTISYPTSKTNYNIFSFRYDSDSTSYIGTVYNYADMPENYIESNAGNISNTENFIPEINNIIIQKVKYLDLDINLGTKPFKVYFTKFGETKGTNYVSPYNTYWKSLFYTSRTYPFTNPLKNNPIFIPYIFNDYENNNMYMEVTFGTNANVTYYCYIGSGFSITTNDDPDTKTVNMLNGIVIEYKGDGTYTVYKYTNGIRETRYGPRTIDSNTICYKSLVDQNELGYYSEIYHGSGDPYITDNEREYFNTVCIHAIADNNASDMGSITINFGPDGYVYQDKVDDLWEYDEFDKLFTTDIDGNFDYAQGSISDLDDQSDYTIDGQLNIGNVQVDEDDPDYIIDGILEYVSRLEITDVVISPNTFETNIGQSIYETVSIIVTFDRIEIFFNNYGEDNEEYLGTVGISFTNKEGNNLTTPSHGTLTYVSHADNTITFSYNYIQTVTSDNLPGDYKYDITIDALDRFHQNGNYTITDGITVTIKPITYHKENKAKLHQFLSASGGGD